jgi:hypothetical protein
VGRRLRRDPRLRYCPTTHSITTKGHPIMPTVAWTLLAGLA